MSATFCYILPHSVWSGPVNFACINMKLHTLFKIIMTTLHDCIDMNSHTFQKRELESSSKQLSKNEMERRDKQKQEELRRELQKVKLRRQVSFKVLNPLLATGFCPIL